MISKLFIYFKLLVKAEVEPGQIEGQTGQRIRNLGEVIVGQIQKEKLRRRLR